MTGCRRLFAKMFTEKSTGNTNKQHFRQLKMSERTKERESGEERARRKGERPSERVSHFENCRCRKFSPVIPVSSYFDRWARSLHRKCFTSVEVASRTKSSKSANSFIKALKMRVEHQPDFNYKEREAEWILALKLLPFVDHYGLSDFNEYTSQLPTMTSTDAKVNSERGKPNCILLFLNFYPPNGKECQNWKKASWVSFTKVFRLF